MDSLKDVTMQIEKLRAELNKLIYEKGNLLDAEVLTTSKMLDQVLNEYNVTLKNYNKKYEM